MFTNSRSIQAAILVAGSFLSSLKPACAVPQLSPEAWSQYGRVPTHTHRSGINLPPVVPAGGSGSIPLKTVAPVGDIQSSPAISSKGRVYLGTEASWLYCYDDALAFAWRVRLGGAAFFSSPAVRDTDIYHRDLIYIGDQTGKLWCIEDFTNSGVVLWSAQLSGPISSSPTLVGRKLYVATESGDVYCFSFQGAQIWVVNVGASCGTSTPAVFSTALGNKVYVGTKAGDQICIDDILGTATISFWNVLPPAMGANSSFSPAIDGRLLTAYFGCAANGTGDGHLFALNALTGATLWTFTVPFNSMTNTKGFLYTPAVGPNHQVFVGSEDYSLYALYGVQTGSNPPGSLQWSTDLGGWIHSAPAVTAGGSVFSTADGVSGKGGFFWLNGRTGAILGSKIVSDFVHSSPAISVDPKGISHVFFANTGFYQTPLLYRFN